MKRIILLGLIIIWGGMTPLRGVAADQGQKAPFNPDEFLNQAVVGPAGDGVWVVPTTQIVKPAGNAVPLPGRPIDLALSPDGQKLAVKTNTVFFIFDIKNERILQTMPFPKGQGGSYCGIAWAADGASIWLTTAKNRLLGATLNKKGTFSWTGNIVLPGTFLRKDGSYLRYDLNGAPRVSPDKDSAPGGLALDEAHGLAYVAMSINNTLAVVDLAAQQVVAEIPVGIAPYDVCLLGGKAYVTNWGGRRPQQGDLTGPTAGSKAVINPQGIASTGTVSVVDLATRRTVREINVMLHPSGMTLSPSGDRLFVANANSDSISVIETARDVVLATWAAQPMPGLPLGSAPNALLVTPDGSQLLAALGGNNCIAVMSTTDGAIQGLIPTGWYPGDLALTGKTLCVANIKGFGSRLRDYSPADKVKFKGYQSGQFLGAIQFVGLPDSEQLKRYTYEVGANMRLPRMAGMLNQSPVQRREVPVPTVPGEVSAFKHVIYIIKENRTYDQVFGDLPQGKGSPALCQFGSNVTPNHHALASEFTLFDNFYCNGVLSADGHQWTDEGLVTDYLEKSFGGFTRSYPYEGDDALAFASSGFIWDHVLRAGLTFRDYGEMVHATISPRGATWAQFYHDYKTGQRTANFQAKSPVLGLAPYICRDYVAFPLVVQDVYRASIFLKEFKQFEAQGNLPNFIIMSLPGNHTSATRPDYPTPRASVADNDLALGQIVEAVGKSRFWKDTAIFVVEDDPQNGLDHVDGHRTVALCISPYTRRGYVDSTQYSQTGMLRTIELILGVGPLTQMTMAANPMVACFQDTPTLAPYRCRPNNIRLDEMNPPLAALKGQQAEDARQSIALPLDEPDKCDEMTLNRILWRSVKGYDTPYPTIKSQLTLKVAAEDDERETPKSRTEQDDDYWSSGKKNPMP